MAKTYKDYCRDAYNRDPIEYGGRINPDGSLKKVYIKDILVDRSSVGPTDEELEQIEKENESKGPTVEISGTQIFVKGTEINTTLKEYPDNCSRKEYKRIWINNKRVIDRINKLKKKYGVIIEL